MKIGNNSVTGIYKYDPNKTFEPEDLVISPSGYLFRCLIESTGIDPETCKNDEYEPYSKTQSATSIKELVNDTAGNLLVPADLLIEYITNLVIGLQIDGTVDAIPYKESELLTMRDTQVHLLTNISAVVKELQVEVGISGNNALLRVYNTLQEGSSTSVCVQEIVDYEGGIILYRYARGEGQFGSWSFVGCNDSNGNIMANFDRQYNSYKNLITTFFDRIKRIQSNLDSYYSFYEVDKTDSDVSLAELKDNKLYLTKEYIGKGSILILFVSYPRYDTPDSIVMQESLYVNPFTTESTISADYFNVEVTEENSRICLEVVKKLSIPRISLDKAIISKMSKLV